MREAGCALDRFDYDTYRGLLTTLIADHVGLRFDDLPMQDPSSPFMLLRHDVDMCLDAALRMAELEADMGIRSTYFLLFSAPMYNLLAARYRSYPRRILDLGHDVGLHYDVSVYEATKSAPMDVLTQELALLGHLAGREIRSISMHNPSITGADPYWDVAGVRNAYAVGDALEAVYWSDSCGAWRDGFVQAMESGPLPPRVQLLIHPEFWAEQDGNRWQRLEGIVEEQVEGIRCVGDLTERLWLGHQGVAEHDRRLLRSGR
ncbi:MAG TPA: hypothetical protein VG455_14425 [Acidimicrobiales bacterium]|nr:hypothetical protein [Acidimicrobiales bacterium]